MIEIELFFKIVEAAIREEQSAYLVAQKQQPLQIDLPTVRPLPEGEEWAALGLWERWRLKRRYKREMKALRRARRHPAVSVEEKLVKGYNAGIEAALKVIVREYKDFERRLRQEYAQDSRC